MKNVRHFLMILSFFVSSALFQFQTVTASKVEDRWFDDAAGYARALQSQRELNVSLVVYFYTDWCPLCRSLDSQYLTAAPVQNYLREVVKVRINPEHGAAEKELAAQFGVTGYPSLFVLRNAASLPMRVHPFRRGNPNLTPAQFASALRQPGLWSIGPLQVSPVSISITPISQSSVVTARSQPVIVSAPISASPANSIEPTVNSILDRYVDAIGGRSAVAKLTSRVTIGRIDVAGATAGRLETYAKAPNLSLTVMIAKPIGTLKRGFDGHNSWVVSNQKGFQNPSPGELAALAADADFYRDIKLKEMYQRISLAGKGNVGAREAYIVDATSRLGFPEQLYFDIETGLLTRRDTMRPSSNGLVRTEFYFADWRMVDGVKIPFKITEQTPGATSVFMLEEVKHNVPLDQGIFRLP